ncbi:MAG TPA: serine/threonine-protein kinase, partial [Gemmataceae bacterium]|nr:serine/threonine-protein kinase [Gemmataceae bacterium]
MISFACPACNKQLKVKDELAGKKGKCPGCGKAVAIPQSTAAATLASQVKPRSAKLEEERTLPPNAPAGVEERTLPPQNRAQAAQESLSDAGRPTALGAGWQGDATRSVLAEGPSPELWDFLAPAEKPDEIGRLGGFRVLKVLGAGGMGVVFQAEDPKLKRKLAIKAMLPALAASETAKQRFLREAQTAAAIEHDHIVPILQVGEDRGVPFIAMPFLKGEPLDDRLTHEPALSLADVARIGRETAEGLAAAHDQGLVHRDIKPANLWLEAPKGRVKILDFGLARAAADNAQLTQQGAIIGTPAYMAPEQASGGAVDARCDLFSLGCVLYRLATGKAPFKGTDTISTLMSVASDQPQPPHEVNPDVPPGLSDLVMRLLAKKPEERPGTAQEVAAALAALAEENTADLAKPRKTRPPRPGGTKKVRPAAARQRWRRLVVAPALLLLVGLAG